jgi:WD40 repeat protein
MRNFFQRKKSRRRSEQAPQQSTSSIPHIPAAIWVTDVLPFLDWASQNRLCVTCKDIYETSKQLGLETAWPEGKFRIRRPVLTVAFSPGGNELAVVPSNSKTILVWNRRRGYDQTLKGHNGAVSDVTFAPNQIMASCSRTDGSIRLWTTGDDDDNYQYYCLRKLVIRVFGLQYIRFSPCSELIASWGLDGMIRLNRAEDASLLGSTYWRSRLGLTCYECVGFSTRQQNQVLAHSFNNQTVRLWNWRTQTSMELRDADRTIAVDYAAYITSIVVLYQPDEGREYLVVGCRVATVKVWDLQDFTCVRTIHLGTGWSSVTHLVFSRDGSKMACTSEGSQIRVYSAVGGHCIGVFSGHKDQVASLSFSPDGEILASGACDRTVRLWSLSAM